MEHFNFSKIYYRVTIYDNNATSESYMISDRLKLKRDVHTALSNGFDVIVRFLGPVGIHLKTFNHADYVHSNC